MRLARAAVLLLAACDSRTSFDSIRVQLIAAPEGDELALRLLLSSSPSNPFEAYEQERDERFVVSFRGKDIPLVRTRYGDYPYVASTPFDGAFIADEELSFRFERGNDSEIATATAPAPIMFDPVASVKSTEPIVISWSPIAMDPMKWRGYGCIANGFAEGPVRTDTGTITFPAGVLVPRFLTTPCEMTLSFERVRTSVPSTAFEFAVITVSQVASVDVTVTP